MRACDRDLIRGGHYGQRPTHLTGELFKMATGLALQQVQYRGGGPVVADLLAGQVQVY
jgi:tripartite-type tricarboxylate transporter receptor subunit TctC